MSNTAETPTIIQPDVSANRATNLRKRLFTWFAEQRLHCIVFIAYVTVTVTVSCFHEPWFDEAQAWLIARDCSWKELLTVRTHYEGHPPLWWMLLAIPAKLGMPYEIGLKSLNLMCAALMIWLLEFKTKLPELLKVILPFSYFLCYQYGVTSRPYALMIAAMLLIAINWNNRNTKPWPVILSMMLLCATSSYGLAIAGMLALNWTIQFLCGERSLIKNKQRFAGLVLLLVFAIILLLNVLPAPGTYHGDFDIHGTATTSPAWVSVFNTWLVMPSETLFTSTLSDGNMQFIAFTPSELFMPCVMSCLMWCFLIQICLRRKTASLLLTTYLGISVAFTAHLSMHHAGIILGFFIAILAIDCDIEKINSNDWPQWIRNLNNRVMTLLGPKKTERYLRFFKILGLIFACQRVLDGKRQYLRYSVRLFVFPGGSVFYQNQPFGAIPLDGRLDTRQQERHRFQSRNQQNHRQRRILWRHRLHRLHFLVWQRPYRFSPLLRPYASCQCIQGTKLFVVGMVR